MCIYRFVFLQRWPVYLQIHFGLRSMFVLADSLDSFGTTCINLETPLGFVIDRLNIDPFHLQKKPFRNLYPLKSTGLLKISLNAGNSEDSLDQLMQFSLASESSTFPRSSFKFLRST